MREIMNGFLLYFPKSYLPPGELLESVGIGDLRRTGDQSPQMTPLVTQGPDRTVGRLVGWHDRTRPFSYRPDVQTWAPAPTDESIGRAEGAYWIGSGTDERLQPAAVARDAQVEGPFVTLDDGFQWQVPDVDAIPAVNGFDAKGNFGRRPAPEFEPFWLRCQTLRQAAMERPDEDFTIRDAGRFAALALNVNYRVNADVLDHFETLTDADVVRIIAAATGLAMAPVEPPTPAAAT